MAGRDKEQITVNEQINLRFTEPDPEKNIADFPAYVRFVGDTTPGYFTAGRIYKVLSGTKGSYSIIDDTGEDYMYGLKYFEVLDRIDGERRFAAQAPL